MQEQLNASYPVLPLRDIVVFPHMIVPLFVGREKSVKALEEVMRDDKQILLSSQIDPAEDDPNEEGIYRIGVLANVLQLLKLPDGTVKVLVEGIQRAKILSYTDNEEFFQAEAELIEDGVEDQLAREKPRNLLDDGNVEEVVRRASYKVCRELVGKKPLVTVMIARIEE